jgi:hypothetical protein
LELLEHPRARRAVSLARGGALSAVGLLAGALVATLVRGGLALPAPGAWLCACVGAAAVGVLVAVRSWPPDAGAALVLAAAWAGARAWQLLG